MNGQGMKQQAMGQGAQQGMQMVLKVMELLKQGVTPEQLQAQGVPLEIIEMAIRKLQEAMQQAQPQQGTGLAGMATQNPNIP